MEYKLGDVVSHDLYLTERDGLCTPHIFSDKDLEVYGGRAALEAELAIEYDWFERLGAIELVVADRGFSYNDSALATLISRASRKMSRISEVEFEYEPVDGPIRSATRGPVDQ